VEHRGIIEWKRYILGNGDLIQRSIDDLGY
jgi:hypothetical protein